MCELPSLICALEHCHEAKEFLFAASHGFSWMGKVMLSCFWDGDGIIMTDYLEQGHTITGNYYSALLAKLRSTLAKKSRGKPYSPDLAPSDFFLFPSLKKHLKGQRFHSNEDVISAGEEWFESHLKSYYAQGLLKVKERCQKCVDM